MKRTLRFQKPANDENLLRGTRARVVIVDDPGPDDAEREALGHLFMLDCYSGTPALVAKVFGFDVDFEPTLNHSR